MSDKTDQHDDTSVQPGFACPWCGERHMDRLVWIEDDVVECQTCNCRYDPGPELIWREGDAALERRDER